MAHDVFISYSSKDKPTADAACAVLESKGIRCWIAPRDILPGADWSESIIDAITGSRAFVLVFSAHANDSQQIKREVERAVNRGLPIVPVRIEDVAPAKSLEYFISTPHWLDAYSPPLERHLTYLADVIGHILEGTAVAPRALELRSVPKLDRRFLIGGGVAALAVTLGAWLVLVPSTPPSFTGKWTAQEISVTSDLLSPLPFAFATDPFAKAAIKGPDVDGTFEVSALGQYTYKTAAEDKGTVSIGAKELTFLSDITHETIQLSYYLTAPQYLHGYAQSVGGHPDDSGLTLNGPKGAVQVVLVGKPASGPIGRWTSRVPAFGLGGTISVALEITAEGRYRFHIEFSESGMWQAQDGRWTRTPQNAEPISGTYKFYDANTVTCAGAAGVTVWRRLS